MADYVFIERASNVMRYEVRCRKCAECYGEDTGPAAPAQPVVVEPPILWPPDCEPVEARDWRAELRGHLSAAAHRSRAAVSTAGEQSLAWMLERYLRRTGYQTGGYAGGG